MAGKPVELFEAYLRGRGLHVTGPRRAVVEAVFALPRHFEAADLWAAVRGTVSSAATVYRTLDLLEEAGLIRRVSFGEAHAHYEHVLGREDHGHLVCRRCGRVTEFSDPGLGDVVTQAASRHGFELAEVVVQGYGLCPACRTRGL
ncbi:MAG: transcriptional repressor [Candidatus Bipolaricaulota bacterium]|nr:transcriptional repressor [Candidatus Bipolaricaulota bacterium]